MYRFNTYELPQLLPKNTVFKTGQLLYDGCIKNELKWNFKN